METSVSSVTLIGGANDVSVQPAAHAAGSVDLRVDARPFFQERATDVRLPNLTSRTLRRAGTVQTTASSIYPSHVPLQVHTDFGQRAPRPLGSSEPLCDFERDCG